MKKIASFLLVLMMILPITNAIAEEEATMFENGTDITWALTEAVRGAQKGDVIQLPAGIFYVSGTVRLRGNITLTGAGMDETKLIVTKNGLSGLFTVDNKENITISNFTVDGAGLDVGNIIDAESSNNIRVDRIRIHDLESKNNPIAIHFVKTKDSSITNCEFKNLSLKSEWGCAVRLSHGSSRVVVDNCLIENTGRGGILCDNRSEYLTITNNRVSGSGITSEGLSIELWGNCGYSIVEDNVVDRWLSLDNSPYTALRRNVISNKIWDRIGLIGIEAVGSNNVVVTDCLVDEGVYTGISESNTEEKNYLYWANVTVRGCAQWGAQLQGEDGWCRYQYFYNVDFENTYNDRKPIYKNDAGHGLRFNENCEHFVFEDCTISGNTGIDIQTIGEVNDILFINLTTENNDRFNRRIVRHNTAEETRYKNDFSCPETAKVGEEIKFTNLTVDPDHCLWDFGQGIPTSKINPSYTYTKPGVYTVTMIAWDDAGNGARACRTITVTE